MSLLLSALLLTLTGLVGGSTPAPLAAPAAGGDLVDVAVEAGSFKTLAAALTAAELVGALKGEGPFTVFAPTDEAFAKLPRGTLDSLLKPENKARLAAILTYHVVPGELSAKRVLQGKPLTTLNGQRISIAVDRDGVARAGGAAISATDVAARNGVIHVIDQVLLPSEDSLVATASKAGSFTTLLAAARAAGLVDALDGSDPLTLFAPTDEAFAKLPRGTLETLLKPENAEQLKAILLFHVVPGRVFSDQAGALASAKTLEGSTLRFSARGEGLAVQEAAIVSADVQASNGVIHVIDQVLMPPKREAAVQR